jgi:hypothetical protein
LDDALGLTDLAGAVMVLRSLFQQILDAIAARRHRPTALP